MDAGLKTDQIFRWPEWAVTWRLLTLTMPLGIISITMVVTWGLGLPWAIALLLAASLAPTDPVLANCATLGCAVAAPRRYHLTHIGPPFNDPLILAPFVVRAQRD